MAISAPVNSAQYLRYVTNPVAKIDPYDWGSKIKSSIASLTFTAAGFTTAAAGDISLILLPPGKIRIISHLCRVICPAGTSTSDLDIGWDDYVDIAGATQTGDKDGLGASIDVGGGAIDASFTGGPNAFDTRDGLKIVCSFDTANSPATGTMYVLIAYQQGN